MNVRRVVILPYDSGWKCRFEKAASEVKEVFGKECIEIHHIGSTAVEGLAAKPIIDLMPVVRSIENIDFFNDKMEELGYIAYGENGLPGRRYFQKGGDERTHHVHVYQEGNEEIRRHLAFRDYLRTHTEEAKKYGALKEKLALEYPLNIEAYINGKAELAAWIEKKAMEEF